MPLGAAGETPIAAPSCMEEPWGQFKGNWLGGKTVALRRLLASGTEFSAMVAAATRVVTDGSVHRISAKRRWCFGDEAGALKLTNEPLNGKASQRRAISVQIFGGLGH